MLNNELLNKDIDVFLEQSPLIILDIKSATYMDKSGKDTKNIRHISRRIHFVTNGKEWSFQKAVCCDGVLQLAYIEPRMLGKMNLILY